MVEWLMFAAALTLLSLFAACAVISCYIAYRILQGNGRIPLTVRPESFGRAYEAVSCTTVDGLTLNGWFVPASSPSARTLLLCHGWGANKGEILKFTQELAGRGFNLLFFDSRCCGESGGDLLSIGYLEHRDFDAAAGFLKKHRPNDVYGVFGQSMGAMIAFCGTTRHEGFKAAVLESPFPSHDLAVRRYLRHNNGVPYLPLIPMVLFWLRWRLGADPEAFCPEAVATRFMTPVLAISGADDLKCPPEVAETLLAKLSGAKEHWVVPGANHARCAEAAGPAYVERLARFYSAHMPSDQPGLMRSENAGISR